jgi:hypothetical protein
VTIPGGKSYSSQRIHYKISSEAKLSIAQCISSICPSKLVLYLFLIFIVSLERAEEIIILRKIRLISQVTYVCGHGSLMAASMVTS